MKMPRVLTMTPTLKSPLLYKTCAIVLSLCFLFVSTALTQSLPMHHHHGAHDQQTHEETWCSWSCQAGHGIHVLSIYVENSPQILTLLNLHRPKAQIFHFINPPTSRGPPFPLI